LEEAGVLSFIDVVQTREAFVNSLDRMQFDLIVSDFSLPSFDGRSALEIACQKCPETPFIFVSGTIGEDAAAETLVRGATDYVLKERLGRLIPAVQRALLEVEAQKVHKRDVEALKESKEKYQNLFESNLAATFVSTPDGNVLECNPAYVRMFGFSSVDDAKAANASLLYSDPKKREQMIAAIRTQKQVENFDIQMVTKNKSPLRVIANIVGKFDEQNLLTQMNCYLLDDTKRQLLEQQLIQAQKLESLGTLAGGIAHDFNNILGIIVGHATLVKRLILEPVKLSQSIDVITTAAQRGAALVRQLLTFARKSDVIMHRISLNDSIKEIGSLLRETLPKTITVSVDLQEELPLILADSTQIHQVLLNLCVNARDAMQERGTLGISTRLVKGESVQSKFPKAKLSEYVLVEVSDSGMGMDDETRLRIFEPFFTTKEPGKGTGLGLAVAFGIIGLHHGFIDVASRPGHGTTFSLYFPVNPDEIEPFQIKAEMPGETAGGTETILLVEDEEMLRELAKMALKGKGYNVITASDGEEAIRIYKVHGKEIALVLSDMGLPKLDGYSAFKELKQINPAIKFVLASGYFDPEQKPEILKSGVKGFIQKPYVPNEMLNKIRNVLDVL
jgi:PAS domain S-box